MGEWVDTFLLFAFEAGAENDLEEEVLKLRISG
jgi:hypothetical protein